MNGRISEGAVFHLDGAGISNHFHIVVNVDAATSSVLLMGIVTSHVAMRKQDAEDTDESPDTVVDISPKQCPCLSCPSVVDCNEPFVMSRVALTNLISSGMATFKCFVSPKLTAKIRTGIRKSKSADRGAKGLL